jgi:hypothetical protein
VKLAEIVPTTLDEHGLPAFSHGEVRDRTVERIRRLSTRFDTEFELRNDRLAVVL